MSAPRHQGWLRRTIVSPVLRLLRRGASPRRLAWSLAAGFVIGINPVLGSTTVATLLLAHTLKLNHTAAQIGTHSAYPLQLLLLLPFLRAGSILFGTAALPLSAATMMPLMHQHPLQLVHDLWMWEWHALVVWAAAAILLTPAIAFLLTRILQRTMKHDHPAAAL